MLVSGIAHHNQVRGELIDLYKIMTQKYFTIIAPRSIFLTTEQLERIDRHPPIGGLSVFSDRIESRTTIENIIRAFLIADEEIELGFRYPSRDIPVIYETLQESIRLWIDIKVNSYSYETAPIEELRAMENVARYLFGAYRHYYREQVKKELKETVEYTKNSMANLYMTLMRHGFEGPEDISFVSYLDLWQEQIQSRNYELGHYVEQQYVTGVDPVATPRLISVNRKHTGGGA